MRDLEPERLAALDHTPPTADEVAHLALCRACSDEREAFAALRTAAARLRYDTAPAGDVGERLVSWDALSTSLRAEGLLGAALAEPPAIVASTVASAPLDLATARLVSRPPERDTIRGAAWSARSLRAAAMIAAMIGSAFLGRLSATAGANGGANAGANAGANERVSTAVADGEVERAGAVSGTLASTTPGVASGGFASVGDATASLARAQQEYERASLWLAGNDTTTRSSEVYRARLAALDQMMAASRAALQDAPQDPLLNHYYRATYAAREATLQQLSGTLPVDQTIESY